MNTFSYQNTITDLSFHSGTLRGGKEGEESAGPYYTSRQYKHDD